jgi:hypothetical protein
VSSMCGGRLIIVCVRSYLNTCKGYLLLLRIGIGRGGEVLLYRSNKGWAVGRSVLNKKRLVVGKQVSELRYSVGIRTLY